MPIYEYQCDQCGHLQEILQKISDPPATECGACGAQALRKKVSAASFRLKGGGWYETDFKSGDKKKNLAGDKDSASKKEGGSDKSADSGSKAGSTDNKKAAGAASKASTSKSDGA